MEASNSDIISAWLWNSQVVFGRAEEGSRLLLPPVSAWWAFQRSSRVRQRKEPHRPRPLCSGTWQVGSAESWPQRLHPREPALLRWFLGALPRLQEWVPGPA